VEIETVEGQVSSVFKNIFNEIPELDSKREKISAKFLDLSEPVLGDNKTQELMQALMSVEKIEAMNALVEMI